jgi:phosphoribosylanthranilate isomerase
MRRTTLKFCGFRNVEDVVEAARFGIDAMGFILARGRKRSVEPTLLPAMLERVPEGYWKVGVLQNPLPEELRRWHAAHPFDAFQLHGDESPALCRWVKETLGVRVIKAFSLEKGATLPDPEPYLPWIDVLLLDGAAGGIKGGTGRSFDWNVLPVFQRFCREAGIPLWVAGGITPENVGELVTRFAPDGVDVSSGIETEGRKDTGKMRRLVERVEEVERQCRGIEATSS